DEPLAARRTRDGPLGRGRALVAGARAEERKASAALLHLPAQLHLERLAADAARLVDRGLRARIHVLSALSFAFHAISSASSRSPSIAAARALPTQPSLGQLFDVLRECPPRDACSPARSMHFRMSFQEFLLAQAPCAVDWKAPAA